MVSIDLLPYCGTDETRDYLLKPFSVGDFTYATNGHILLRVARRDDVAEQTKKANWDKPLEGLNGTEFFPPPDYTLPPQPEPEDCDVCEGRGTAHDCPECTCECPFCLGTGNGATEGNISTEYEGVTFALRYIRKVLALPGLKISKPKPDDAPWVFQFDGGFGALMPMRGHSAQHVKVFAHPAEGTGR